jgi:hypothetical protein
VTQPNASLGSENNAKSSGTVLKRALNMMDVPEFRTSTLEPIAAESMIIITNSEIFHELRLINASANASVKRGIFSYRGPTTSE